MNGSALNDCATDGYAWVPYVAGALEVDPPSPLPLPAPVALELLDVEWPSDA